MCSKNSYNGYYHATFNLVLQPQLEGHSVECIPAPSTLTLTFRNLITSSPVAKGMTDEVWWQSERVFMQYVRVT